MSEQSPSGVPAGSPAPGSAVGGGDPYPGSDAGRSDLADAPPRPSFSDADRDELERFRTERADREHATADPTGDTPPCPGCGTTSLNPAPHERELAHCWRCGYGSAPGQTYPPESD